MKAAMTRMRSALGRRQISGVGRRFRRAGGFDRRFRRRRRAGAEQRRLRAPAASHRLAPRFERRASRGRAPTRRTRAHRGLCAVRSAAAIASSCSSARIRRRNAASSTPRSRACRPISPICRRAPAAGPAISSPATTPNASTRRRGRPISSRLCSAASRGSRPRSSSSRRRTPDSSRSITGRLTEPPSPGSPTTGAASRRMPAPTRFACALATAASSPFPIPAPGAAPTAWRRSAGPCAPTPTWRSTRFRSAERSTRPSRRRASLTPICPTPANSSKAYDPSCSCRRKGQSWAEALADAEARYGHEKHDIIVTPEKSAEMARPIIDPKAKPAVDPKAKPGAPGAAVVAGPGGRAWQPTPPWRRSERAGPRRQRRGHQTQRRGRHGQPRGVRHRRRRRRGREELQRESGANGGSHRTRRGQTDGADSRASALARPISGRRAASSGPASRPVNARRKG